MTIPTISQLQASWAYAPDSGTITFPIPLLPAGPANDASLEKGFPQITMPNNPEVGDPPNGQDMNGILNQLSQLAVAYSVGMGFVYNATIYNNTNPYITGYPIGSRVMRSDNQGYWLNLLNNNQTDPDNPSLSADWVPDSVYGFFHYTIASNLITTITLTIQQAAMESILIDQSTTPASSITLVLPSVLLKSYYIKNGSAATFTIQTDGSSNVVLLPPQAETIVYVYSSTIISSLALTYALNPILGYDAYWSEGSGNQIQISQAGVAIPFAYGSGQTWISGNAFVAPWTGVFSGYFVFDWTLSAANQVQHEISRNAQLIASSSLDITSAQSGTLTMPFTLALTAGDSIYVTGRTAATGTDYSQIIFFSVVAIAN